LARIRSTRAWRSSSGQRAEIEQREDRREPAPGLALLRGKAAQRRQAAMAHQFGAGFLDGTLPVRPCPCRQRGAALQAERRQRHQRLRPGRLEIEEQMPLGQPDQRGAADAMAAAALEKRALVAREPARGRVARLEAEPGVEPPGAGFERFFVVLARAGTGRG
jgi:hypothetical protein